MNEYVKKECGAELRNVDMALRNIEKSLALIRDYLADNSADGKEDMLRRVGELKCECNCVEALAEDLKGDAVRMGIICEEIADGLKYGA